MNREDIIRMYEKANGWSPEGWDKTVDELERFANLVAAAEREACAALCFQMWNEWLDSEAGDDFLDTSNCPDAEDCAAAIRERGAP